MLSHNARSAGGPLLDYQVLMVIDQVKPDLITLKSICGTGDEGPVITIMFRDED